MQKMHWKRKRLVFDVGISEILRTWQASLEAQIDSAEHRCTPNTGYLYACSNKKMNAFLYITQYVVRGRMRVFNDSVSG